MTSYCCCCSVNFDDGEKLKDYFYHFYYDDDGDDNLCYGCFGRKNYNEGNGCHGDVGDYNGIAVAPIFQPKNYIYIV